MSDNPRTASLYVTDIRGNNVFHAFQVNYGPEWHYFQNGYTGVMIAMSEADLARCIAKAVGPLGEGWELHSAWVVEEDPEHRSRTVNHDCYPDPMGGVVMDGEYLGWGEWIRRVIPRSRVDLAAEVMIP